MPSDLPTGKQTPLRPVSPKRSNAPLRQGQTQTPACRPHRSFDSTPPRLAALRVESEAIPSCQMSRVAIIYITMTNPAFRRARCKRDRLDRLVTAVQSDLNIAGQQCAGDVRQSGDCMMRHTSWPVSVRL